MMAQVTIELRHVLNMDDFILFDFDYPITDLGWKNELEQSFIDKFYFNEIGLETIDRWKHALKTKMNLIMPYYDKLYMTTLEDYDPFVTMSIKEEYTDTGKTENVSSATANGSGDYETVGTEYPHTSAITTDIPSDRSKTQSTSLNTSESAGETTTQKDYSKLLEGFQGDRTELLKKYRDNILNDTEMVLNDLKSLFILVY